MIRTVGTETQVIRVRLSDNSDGDLSTKIAIREGDLIVVPPTMLARVGYAVQMLGASAAGSIASGTRSF